MTKTTFSAWQCSVQVAEVEIDCNDHLFDLEWIVSFSCITVSVLLILLVRGSRATLITSQLYSDLAKPKLVGRQQSPLKFFFPQSYSITVASSAEMSCCAAAPGPACCDTVRPAPPPLLRLGPRSAAPHWANCRAQATAQPGSCWLYYQFLDRMLSLCTKLRVGQLL